jgi:histidinol-phosphate aminotransferase
MITAIARRNFVLTRRVFTAAGALAAGRMLPEMAYAQRAAIRMDNLPKDMVWLNANENPLGPPKAALQAMTEALPTTGRYHYQEYRDFYAAVARSQGLAPEQVLLGAGSSEVLHAAVDAFTSPSLPLIAIAPTYEGPIDVARAHGREIVRVPLTESYAADVKKLIEAADKSKGGLIYLCNPNNPTGSVTSRQDIDWLVANLPRNSVALIDEAYIDFGETPALESALKHVKQGSNVVVTRTFSKIYGMAGLRAGYACGPAELIARMAPYRNNVISYLAVRAVLAALAYTQSFLPQRRTAILKTRRELVEWLRERGLSSIESHANFMMIDLKRDAKPVIYAMPPKGVAVGRPFPPMDNFLRVSIGTDEDMKKFREVFWSVYNA